MSDASVLSYHEIVDADEGLHPVAPDAHFTAVETNYYGFNCASAGLDAHLYMWFHPAMKVMMLDFFIYRGLCDGQLSATYHNHVNYLPMPADISDYTMEAGSLSVRLQTIKPLKEIRITAKDPKVGLDLQWTTYGSGPPVGRPGGGHFTQLMRNVGTLQLRGKTYDLAGHFVRDRSFSYFRTEDAQLGPPYNWLSGWWAPDTGFHCTLLDTSIFKAPEFGPEWDKHISTGDASKTMIWEKAGAKTPSLNLRYGWWLEKGELRRLVDVKPNTKLAPGTTRPASCELDITDETGAVHRVRGKTLSHVKHFTIQNNENSICFMDWEVDGRHGNGNLETVYTNDHLHDDIWK
ncbi:MAG: hypothetical protein ABWZ40_15070 [Caulobacterales bacterium]